ncbi:MAG: succinate dehydrogenase cytochrome b subunit [Deltaproteobacteria bacterium]|uniref:succinate dehydrogenase cytochrome b subunit n=1 Tax=Candidatus Deferrimicrobium sp. TaxID=3060586 RepID=UPI002718F611|nr:succinate dehydrogenase cytochrome b subunit [Candidatus Deferrimicrobium sp.]MCR4308758.1 succinate dehydrogenase cytochrome b subunit [Deltaproteobacteria bacterium]MDO8737920.1 succinate dehydrogenase cytochrome b subunit [Candidatus Deferrimicrobium sp.]MDP2657541.1 succinate dehydrogenase cytochrome b subunit [Candidatus Deferrimicrobium sp.]
MRLFSDSIGRKAIVAVTGLFMVLFVVTHLLGNSTIFAGPDGINTYAEKLQALGPFVWVFRIFMAAMLCLHVIFAILLTLENRAANPGKYAVKKMLKTTFAGETMIWTGLLLLAFIVYHLLQFTLHITPDVVLGNDAKNRFDVFTMVFSSLRITPIALAYVAAMVTLFLHLSHGIQSIFQTFGLNNEKTMPQFDMLGKLLSALFLVGYSAIPVLILAGILAK